MTGLSLANHAVDPAPFGPAQDRQFRPAGSSTAPNGPFEGGPERGVRAVRYFRAWLVEST